MSYTIPQIPTTATVPSNDDYFELGGLIGGSRKILANSFVLTTDPRLTYNGTVTEVSASGGSTGFNFTGGPINVSGTLVLAGTLKVASGGTGATSLTGYVYGNGVDVFTASTTIPGSAITGDISVTGHFISTLSDGTYQYKLVRTGSNARTYGLAISGANGELLIDDITAGVSRLRIDTSGRVTAAAGLNSTPIGNVTPSTGAFTTVEASHVIRTSGDAQSDQAASAAIDYSTGTARFWSWGPDTSTVGKAVVRLAKSNGTGTVEPILFKSTGVDITGTLSATGVITSTVASGTAPFTVASTTNVPNLNASLLNGKTFSDPGAIGNTTASTGAFTTLSASSTVSGQGFIDRFSSPGAIGNTTASTGAFTTLEASGIIRTTGTAATDKAASVAIDYTSGTARLWSWGPDTSTVGQAVIRLAKSNGTGAVEPIKFKSTGVDITGDLTVSGKIIASTSVANRTDLRAFTSMVNGQVVFEDGYFSKGDGGGGFWYFDSSDTSSIDNDGTHVVPAGSYGVVATTGCWHRSGFGKQTLNNTNVSPTNVRWFGAGTSSAEIYADCTQSVTRAFNAALGKSNALYFPSGVYPFKTMLVLDAAEAQFTIFGDGPSTEIAYSFGSADVSTNYCMWQLKRFGTGGQIRDFHVSNRPINSDQNYPLSIIRVTSGSGCYIKNISMSNMMTDGTSPGITYAPNSIRSQAAGGSLWIESGTAISVENIYITGNFGTALCIGGGGAQPSVRLSKCWLFQNSISIPGVFQNGVMGVKPTLWIASGDTLQVDNIFVENGGPYRAFPSSSITSYGSYFVVTTPSAHNFEAGDYIVINGASNTAYNHKWRIRSTTTNTIRVESAVSGNEASVYCTSLFVCCLFGGGISSQNSVAESTITNIFTNQGGKLIEGSMGLYLCARKATAGALGYMAGMLISNIYSDFGESTLFIHGTPSADSSAGAILCSNIRANGGPRSPFGGVRVEIGNRVTINSPFMEASLTAFAGDLITPNPGTGNWPYSPITAIALSDGGADNPTTYGIIDISINGGILQDTFRSSQLAGNGLVSTALSVDGSRISNIRSTGSLVDLISSNSTPLILTNGATENTGKVLVDFWPGRILQASILSGNAVLSIAQCDQVKLVPELGYGGSGTVTIRLDLKTSNYIALTGNITFVSAGLASGNYIFLALKNTTGSTVSIGWPSGWNWAGVSAPTSLNAGASLLLRIFCFGTTDSSVFATY